MASRSFLAGLAIATAMLVPSVAHGDDCVPPYAGAWVEPSSDGSSLTYCYESDKPICKLVDLARGTWSPSPRVAADPSRDASGDDAAGDDQDVAPGDLTVTTAEITRCDASKHCQRWPRPAALTAGIYTQSSFALDDARQRLVVTSTTAKKLEVAAFDLATGKRLARKSQRIAPDTMVDLVSILDDGVVVRTYACAGPCSEAWLFDLKKLKRLRDVGGKLPFEAGALDPIRIKPNVFAFHDSDGHGVVVQDVHTGKLIKQIRLLPDLTGTEFSTRIIRRAQGDLLLWGDGGFVALVDPIKGSKRIMTGPVCAE